MVKDKSDRVFIINGGTPQFVERGDIYQTFGSGNIIVNGNLRADTHEDHTEESHINNSVDAAALGGKIKSVAAASTLKGKNCLLVIAKVLTEKGIFTGTVDDFARYSRDELGIWSWSGRDCNFHGCNATAVALKTHEWSEDMTNRLSLGRSLVEYRDKVMEAFSDEIMQVSKK